MYKAIGYFNTGFDIINIPNTPALLRSSATKREEYPVFDILQTRFLSSIKIKLTNANQYTNSEWALEGLDYIELVEDGSTTHQKSVFYYVSGYTLTSKDVAVLNIVQDSLLTAGVVTNGTISGNIFYKRCTIPKSLDTFGTWDLDDELLCPMEPLQLVHEGQTYSQQGSENRVSHSGFAGMFFVFTHSNGYTPGTADYRSYEHTLIQSAVGLTSNGSALLNMSNLDSYLEGNTYLTSNEEGVQYTTIQHSRYPQPYNPRQVDLYLPTMILAKGNLADVSYRVNHNPKYVAIHYGGVEYEDLKRSHDVQEALNVIRSLGMESAILACYSLPSGAGELVDLGGANISQTLTGRRWITSTNGWYDSGELTGEKSDADSLKAYQSDSYDYDYLVNSLYPNLSDHTAHNMRILYGKFRKYVICSPATGSSQEALPEELTGLRWSYSESKVGKHGSPYVCCFTDPRPTGRPYYNFLKFGMTPSTMNLYQGAIAGGQWSEVPITFTGMSGEFQARVGYNLDASYRDYLASPERTYRNMVSGAQMERHSAIEGAYANFGINAMQNAATGATIGAAGGPYGAAAGAAGGVVKAGMDTAFAEARANTAYQTRLESANYDMLRGASGNYHEAELGNITANNLVERNRAREYERAKFELATEYSVPRASFMATDSMRDITENCLFYARYTPTVRDLERMDHILDAYGYKVNSFNQYGMGLGVGRSRYCYMEGSIECNGTVANMVGGKDMLADINSQLANGVRVWKVKPDGVLNPGD